MMLHEGYNKTRCLPFAPLVELELYKLFLRLNKELGATYMSYTFDCSNQVRYSFRSDECWASIYNNQEIDGKLLIEQCPLDITSRFKKNKFIVWDNFLKRQQPKVYREIMGLREDLGLSHGLTLSLYFGSHHDALAIATEEKSENLAKRILLSREQISLYKHLILCRKLVVNHFKVVK